MTAILVKIRAVLVKALEVVIILLFAALVVDVLMGVITRSSGRFVVWLEARGTEAWAFLPRGQVAWSEEVAINLLIWVALLGGALAYGQKAHLGVDYFVNKLHIDARRMVELVINIVVGFFAVSVFIYGGYFLVYETLRSGQVTPALSIKMGYIYMAVPISGLFILLFCLENIVELAAGKNTPPKKDPALEHQQEVLQPEAT